MRLRTTEVSSDEDEFELLCNSVQKAGDEDFSELVEEEESEVVEPFEVDRFISQTPNDPAPCFEPTLLASRESLLEQFYKMKDSLAHTLHLANQSLAQGEEEPKEQPQVRQVFDQGDHYEAVVSPKSDPYVDCGLSTRPYSFLQPTEKDYAFSLDGDKDYAGPKMSNAKPYAMISEGRSGYAGPKVGVTSYVEVVESTVPYTTVSDGLPDTIGTTSKPYCYAY